MGSARHNSILKKKGIEIGEEMFQETEVRTNNDHNWEKQKEKRKMVLPVKTSPDNRLSPSEVKDFSPRKAH